MPDAPRYEIVDKIAAGDFAVVYRARDRELGREVAIKQIHQQYLADQRQLARYWREAQMLASLQHPNILTIYDVVRSKGWLILELMHGTLQPATESEGIDLDYLRSALIDCLSALDFLHANGVVHGDIKPSNMLVDARGRVKLGDFGLARRASNEEGSLLKGATKYMAPELVSDQFGAVGPASDLYSLGFAAYELLCGKQFETLFPGLGSFGRDRQIAWMMWHAAADRALPPISKVLEGVPPELARTIEHLVVKDQTRRCQSAKEALWELRVDKAAEPPMPSTEQPDAEAQAALIAAKKKRQMRWAAVVAMTFSAILCAAMLWPKSPPPRQPAPAAPLAGRVAAVYPNEWKLGIMRADNGAAEEITLNRYDRVLINGRPRFLRDLRPGDQIVRQFARDAEGRRIAEIQASRPEVSIGRVKSVDADQRRLTLVVEQGEDQGKELVLAVPDKLTLTLNANAAGKPLQLADVLPGDHIEAHHVGSEAGREAVEISLQRRMTAKGKIADLSPGDAKTPPLLKLNVGTDEQPEYLTLPLAADCEITLNSRRIVEGRALKPADLRPGDEATVAHDSRCLRVDAYRAFKQQGAVSAVHYDAGTLELTPDGEQRPVTYLVGENCEITLGGKPAKLADLRVGDRVEATHDSPGAARPEALKLAATRPADRRRWAILIGVGDYDDQTLGRARLAAADARLVRDAIIERYKLPPEQTLLLTDESLVRLEQAISDRLGKLTPDDSLLIYVAGRAFKADDGRVYFAPKSFDLRRAAVTGMALQWLVDRMEQCRAKEKLLVLDCSRADDNQAAQPSTAEMLRSLEAPAGQAALRTVTAVASCRDDQRGVDWPEKGHGLFAWLLAEGLSGAADNNRDGRIEPTELFGYLRQAVPAAAGQLGAKQTPELFLPDDRPPRLSPEAKLAIRRLAAWLSQPRIDSAEADRNFHEADRLAAGQLEPRLLYGLVLMKDKRRDEAQKLFEELRLQRPELLLPHLAVAFLRFERRAYDAGVDALRDLVAAVPTPQKPGEKYSESALEAFNMAGRMREYAAEAVEEKHPRTADAIAALDAAIERHGPDAQRPYAEGRAKSREINEDFLKRIAAATGESEPARLRVERRRMVHYVDFPYDRLLREILDGLDR
jgi:tRNA A-37 threonylcarbamoyl transferase component Bud32